MKNIFILFIVVFFVNPAKADYFEVDAFNKVVSISKIAREGKISIFVISAKWCAPCHKLRNNLLQANLDMNEIDIWYISMSGEHSYSEVKQTNAYYSWRVHERIEEWPTVYITSKNTNVVKKFSGSTLVEEGNKLSIFDNTIRIINLLQENEKKYPQLADFEVLTEKDRPKPISINNALKKYNLEKTDVVADNSNRVTNRNNKKANRTQIGEETKNSPILSGTIELTKTYNQGVILSLPIENKLQNLSLYFQAGRIDFRGELTETTEFTISVGEDEKYQIKEQFLPYYSIHDIVITIELFDNITNKLFSKKQYKGKMPALSETETLTEIKNE